MDASAEPGQRQRLWHWVSERPMRQWWKAGVATILAIAALFGGFDTVDNRVTEFQPDEEFSDGQYTLTLERARLIDEVTGGGRVVGPASPGHLYLGVVATLRNDGTVPGRLHRVLDPRDLADERFYGVFRYRDGSPIAALGPGLTEQLVFTWLIPENSLSAGDGLTVRVWKKLYRQLMVAYGGQEWIDSPTDYGVTVLPVGVSS